MEFKFNAYLNKDEGVIYLAPENLNLIPNIVDYLTIDDKWSGLFGSVVKNGNMVQIKIENGQKNQYVFFYLLTGIAEEGNTDVTVTYSLDDIRSFNSYFEE